MFAVKLLTRYYVKYPRNVSVLLIWALVLTPRHNSNYFMPIVPTPGTWSVLHAWMFYMQLLGLVMNLPAKAGDVGLIPGSRRSQSFSGSTSSKEHTSQCGRPKRCWFSPWVWSSGGGHGNPLQYSCLENSMDRGAWWTAVNRAAKSWTQPQRLSTHMRTLVRTHTHTSYGGST